MKRVGIVSLITIVYNAYRGFDFDHVILLRGHKADSGLHLRYSVIRTFVSMEFSFSRSGVHMILISEDERMMSTESLISVASPSQVGPGLFKCREFTERRPGRNR